MVTLRICSFFSRARLVFMIPIHFYTICKLQTSITWPQIVCFYSFKVPFGAVIEEKPMLCITQKSFSASSYPFLKYYHISLGYLALAMAEGEYCNVT